MKKFFVIFFALVIFIPTYSFSESIIDKKIITVVKSGWFESNSDEDPLFDAGATIWKTPGKESDGSRSGIPIGKITRNTKVFVVGSEDITAENIKLLNGKRVTVFSRFELVGYDGYPLVNNPCLELFVIILH